LLHFTRTSRWMGEWAWVAGWWCRPGCIDGEGLSIIIIITTIITCRWWKLCMPWWAICTGRVMRNHPAGGYSNSASGSRRLWWPRLIICFCCADLWMVALSSSSRGTVRRIRWMSLWSTWVSSFLTVAGAGLRLPPGAPLTRCRRWRLRRSICVLSHTALSVPMSSKSGGRRGRCRVNTSTMPIAFFRGWLSTIRALFVDMRCLLMTRVMTGRAQDPQQSRSHQHPSPRNPQLPNPMSGWLYGGSPAGGMQLADSRHLPLLAGVLLLLLLWFSTEGLVAQIQVITQVEKAKVDAIHSPFSGHSAHPIRAKKALQLLQMTIMPEDGLVRRLLCYQKLDEEIHFSFHSNACLHFHSISTLHE